MTVGHKWSFSSILQGVILIIFVPFNADSVTFQASPTNPVVGQTMVLTCNDATATAPNSMVYTHTLSNGTDISFGTCSNNQSVSGWQVTWSTCAGASSSLTIQNVSLEAEGTWKCTSGGTNQALVIVLHYKPMLNYANSILQPPPDVISVDLTFSVTFAIKVKARPAVSNYTANCSRSQPSNLNLVPVTAGTEYRLTLTNAKYSDFGNYTCEIRNSIGTLQLKYLIMPKGPQFTITKVAVTAISATLRWDPQVAGTFTPSYVTYYKQSNMTHWLSKNEATPTNQTPSQSGSLKVTYKLKALTPDSEYDFKVKMVLLDINYTDAATSNVLLKIRTQSLPNITNGNIHVTADKGETFVTWDKFAGHYTHIIVRYCVIKRDGAQGPCKNVTVRDPKRVSVKLVLPRGQSHSFYLSVFDGDDMLFESIPLLPKGSQDPNKGTTLTGGEIGGIVLGIIISCLVFTAVVIVLVRFFRKRKELRLKFQTSRTRPESGPAERHVQGVTWGDTQGHDNPVLVSDPYYQVPISHRKGGVDGPASPTSTLQSQGSGIYESVGGTYERPLPSPPARLDSTYTSLNPERIYLNVPPPKSNPAVPTVGQPSPKLNNKSNIYENVPTGRQPEVSTVNHIYVNTGFAHDRAKEDEGERY